MYGDCQIMSDSLFSSQIQNPNFNFMGCNPFPPPMIPKEEIGLMRNREDMESGSGSDQVEEKSGNEQENDQPPKKKRYHRHTARQIQEMESLFKECPHPDDKQRQKLSQELGLKPRQVKFWFQNRRTQMKAQQDRSDNAILRVENDNLKHDNYRLQAMLRSVMCPNCGGPAILDGSIAYDEQQLRLENASLKEELERVCAFASQFNEPSLQSLSPRLLAPSLDLDMNIYSRNFTEPMATCPDMIPVPMLPNTSNFSEGGIVLMEEEKSMAMELAISSMAEMMKMCVMDEPLWIRNENGKEMLNCEEYERNFGGQKMSELSTELRREVTRDNVLVIMNSISLVDAFFDANKWMELFPSIVSRAKTIQVISSDNSSHANGSLHLMYAELQVLTPLVPTREAHFFRYCQQNIEEGTWAIVDFPIHNFHDILLPSFPIYKRRPSGCIFQDMPNGYLKVTWIEHAEVEEKPVHQIFSDYISSGMAFGAKRWLSVLKRQCERAASFMARNISDLGVIPSPEARKNLMKLSQRMVRTFCINISTSGGQSWTALSDSSDETIRITTRKITEPGQPNGVILGAVSTTWLPYSHTHVFDVLRDEHRRSQIDVLSNGNTLHEIAHIANASDPGNSISLLRINVASNSSQNVELILQESLTNDNGSLVVYTTISVDAIQLAMNGQDPSSIPLLPLGFVVIPDRHVSLTPDQNPKRSSDSITAGSLLTVGLQVLASTIPSAKINLSTVSAVNNHLCNTVSQIAAVMGGGGITGGNGGCADDSGVEPVGVLEQG